MRNAISGESAFASFHKARSERGAPPNRWAEEFRRSEGVATTTPFRVKQRKSTCATALQLDGFERASTNLGLDPLLRTHG